MKHILSIFCLLFCLTVKAQYSVSSPDMKVWVTLKTKTTRNLDTKMTHPTKMKVDVSVKGKTVIEGQEIGLTILSHGHRYSFGKANVTAANVSPEPLTITTENDGELAALGDKCKRLLINTDRGIVLEVLVFDAGIAYRFSVTGYPDDYKILNVCDVFPDERPNAILGTFTGDKVLPWRTMRLDETQEPAPFAEEWQTTYPATKIVSWRDALSSVSIGFTTNWISGGKTWGGTSQSHGVYADFIYKHLYGGLSFTPSHELTYIFWERDFEPFKGVIGGIYSWDMTARFGYNLPVQFGYNVWSFAPYASATYLALHQHGETRIGFNDIQKKSHCLLGLGLKVQYMMHERISLGVGYEFQFFTGSQEPIGRSFLLLTIGYGL